MLPALYGELVPFYHLLDPLEDHAGEGSEYGDVLLGAVEGASSLLELGAGAGHGAHYVKRCFERVTLTDLSGAMLDRSRTLNPDCEHVEGDMRSLRLPVQFDCVLIHDAIAYIATRTDLLSTLRTAAAHLRPGGAALLVPDCLKESFREGHEDHAGDDDERSLRAIAWSHDPDPNDDTYLYDFAFLLREHGQVRAVHDRHVCGLFDEATWLSTITSVGLRGDVISRPLPPEYADTGYTDRMFLCHKPRPR